MSTTPATAPNPYDFADVCKSRDGKTYPDLYNVAPKRLLTRGDAEELGFPYYADGSPCRYGHVAPRFTANAACVDCHRTRKSIPTIGTRAHDKVYYKLKDTPPAAASGPATVAAPVAPLQVEGRDKRIIEAIAEHKSIDGAAKVLKVTPASIEARRATDPTFASALAAVESRLDIKRALPDPTDYEWTAEKEQKLCRIWVDTGDVATARDSIACSSSQYFEHIESSAAFAAMVDKAAPLAKIALRERAQQLALLGNSSLLKEFIPPQPPEDLNPAAGKTRDQLIDEIVRTLGLAKQRIATQPVPEPVAQVVADAPDDDEDMRDLL